MTSRQQTSLNKSSKSYLINTRATKREIDSKPIHNMIENSAESPSNSADDQPGFSGQSADEKSFSFNKDSFISKFNFKLPPLWSHDADSWLDWCDAKFNTAGINTPVLKFMTILETLTTGQLEKLYDIPKPQDPDCYTKLCNQIKAVYAKDDSEKLDILLNNLTLGDRSPMDLMRHLIAASGLEENPSPQFETIIKDRFLKALPAKVAACSGNWFYTDLLELATCATEYMKANKRYTEGSTSSDNLKDTTVSSISNRPHNSQSYRQPFRNCYKNPKTSNLTAPGNSRFQGREYTYSRTRGYICYFHRKFRQMAIKCEGPQCKFFDPRIHSNRPMNHLNAGGWEQNLLH